MQPGRFDTHPELSTQRLRLRAVTLADAERLAAIYSHPDVVRYLPYDPSGGVAQMEEKLTRDLEAVRRGEAFRWAVCERGQDTAQGSVTLFHWSQRERRAEVGYVLDLRLWGRGLMKELMPELLRFGFEEMALHRIEALVDSRNTASLRVLTREGFQREGVLRDYTLRPDGFGDAVMLSLLEGEWRR